MAPEIIPHKRTFLALKLLWKIQQEIKVSTKAVSQRDYVLCSRICGHFVLGQTFGIIRSRGATETAERVSLQRAGVSKWWRELWETFISQIHFIDPGPVRAELTVVGGLEENEWLLAHMLTPKEPPALTLPQRLWNSLWWLFYQRSCASPGRSRTREDDPHFLKAKCSVLISRNELLVTRVNLLRPGRFIVSCHSWTHRADLSHPVLSRAACPWVDARARRSTRDVLVSTARDDDWISNNDTMESVKQRRPNKKKQDKEKKTANSWNRTFKKNKPRSHESALCSLIIHRLCTFPFHPSRLKGVRYPNNFRLDKINVQFITWTWRVGSERWKVNICGWKGHFSYTERSKP